MVKIVTKKMQDPGYHNRTCPICNETFYTYPSNIKLGRGIYCSVRCKSVAVGMKFKGENNQTCAVCGKTFHVRPCRIKNNHGIYCSHECHNKSEIGTGNPHWKGGISFEPYCPKFNKDLKTRIRAFFDNQCVLCGKSAEENKVNMGCHHVTYDKMICCNGKPVRFAALCVSCHGKTNHNREKYEAMLHRIIDEIYGGRSYFTKEEWEALRRKEAWK